MSTKERILNEALRLFSAKGYIDVYVDDIAKSGQVLFCADPSFLLHSFNADPIPVVFYAYLCKKLVRVV